MKSGINWVNRNKPIICLILSFLIPVAIVAVAVMVLGLYPFGDMSALVADTRYQFTDYFGYLKHIFFENDDMFYTFSKTFGGDMAGLYAYYLGNPLALILLLFPNDLLPVGILILLTLMIGLCGLTFNIFLCNIYDYKWANLIFSTSFAFMGYMTGYFNCITYFFNILLLPIIMLGIYKLVKEEKINILYMVSLFISVFCCYYIGYMTCIFAAMFFAYLYVSNYPGWKNLFEHIKTFLIFAICSIVAVGMAAVGLLCAVLSLQGQKSSGINLSLMQKFRFPDVFSGFYSTSFHGNISDGMPLIYSGVIVITLLFLFYFNRSISLVKKIASAVVIFIFFVSFWIDGIDIMWHGFSHPIGFPYRYSFLLSFFIIYLAYESYLSIEDGLKIRDYIVTVGIFGIYSVYLYITHNINVGVVQTVYTFILVLATLMSVYLKNQSRDFVIPVMIALIMLQCGDAYVNLYTALDAYFPGRETTDDYDMEKYQNFVNETEKLVNLVKNNDPGFYRMEKLYRRTNNDQMMFGYNGLSHFSSCENDTNKRFMGSLGFRDNGNWAFYGEGSTSFADCLMGVKYILSQYDETPKPYEQILNMEGKYVYLNKYALPLAFGVNESMKNADFSKNDHFSYQNVIASSFSDKNYNIYKEVNDVSTRLVNVEKTGNTYSKINKDEEAYIEYSFKADRTDFIYMYYNAPDLQDVGMRINDLEKEPYFTKYGWSVRELGHYRIGEKVDVKLLLNQDEIKIDSYEFYYEDLKELAAWYEDAVDTKCQLNKITSSHLKGSINVASGDEMIVFSIPYEKEWTVKVDGEKTDTYEILDCLMAIDVSEGPHTIELTYIPKGIILGTPVSAVFILIFIGMAIWQKRKDIAVVE